MRDAMTAGKGKQISSQTLASLVAYTKLHFSNEKRLIGNMATRTTPRTSQSMTS